MNNYEYGVKLAVHEKLGIGFPAWLKTPAGLGLIGTGLLGGAYGVGRLATGENEEGMLSKMTSGAIRSPGKAIEHMLEAGMTIPQIREAVFGAQPPSPENVATYQDAVKGWRLPDILGG